MTTRLHAGAHVPVAPARWAVVAVHAAARTLPAGAVRDRYLQEFVSELYDLPRLRQAAYTCGVLSRTWALRTAVTAPVRPSPGDAMTIQTVRKPLLCALNLKHTWVTRFTDDGGRYRICRRCGKSRNPTGTYSTGFSSL